MDENGEYLGIFPFMGGRKKKLFTIYRFYDAESRFLSTDFIEKAIKKL